MKPYPWTADDEYMQAELVAVAERRAFTRREVAWPIRVLRENGEHLDAICTDVGSGGMGLQTQSVLRAGEIVDLQFLAGGGDGSCLSSAIPAQVIYRIGEHYGVSFVPPGDMP